MKKTVNNTARRLLFGFFTGLLSGAAGAGGGMITVPFLKKSGFSQKAAQQNAVAVILPIAALSAAFYIFKGYVTAGQSAVYMPAGLLGAAAGAYIISRVSPVWLRIFFGAFMVYAGWRLCFG